MATVNTPNGPVEIADEAAAAPVAAAVEAPSPADGLEDKAVRPAAATEKVELLQHWLDKDKLNHIPGETIELPTAQAGQLIAARWAKPVQD